MLIYRGMRKNREYRATGAVKVMGKGRCAERSGIAVWVLIVLFRFERKIRSEFIKREAGDKKCF